MFIRSTLLLPIGIVALLTGSEHAKAGTVLVNFGNPSAAAGSTIATATAADFAINDSAINLTTSVVLAGVAGGTIVGDAIDLDIAFASGSVSSNNAFNFTAGDTSIFGTSPIIDSYVAIGGGNSVTLTISGIEEIPTGEDITLVVYSAGDQPTQTGSLTLTHGTFSQGPDVTSFIAPSLDDTFISYTFQKEDGVDEITILNDNAGGSPFTTINGFSLTSAVPEPSSALLLMLAGGFGLLGRHRK